MISRVVPTFGSTFFFASASWTACESKSTTWRIHTWFESFQEKWWSSKPASIKSAFVLYILFKCLTCCQVATEINSDTKNVLHVRPFLWLVPTTIKEHQSEIVASSLVASNMQCMSQIRNLDVDSFSKLIPSIYTAAYVYIVATEYNLPKLFDHL